MLIKVSSSIDLEKQRNVHNFYKKSMANILLKNFNRFFRYFILELEL